MQCSLDGVVFEGRDHCFVLLRPLHFSMFAHEAASTLAFYCLFSYLEGTWFVFHVEGLYVDHPSLLLRIPPSSHQTPFRSARGGFLRAELSSNGYPLGAARFPPSQALINSHSGYLADKPSMVCSHQIPHGKSMPALAPLRLKARQRTPSLSSTTSPFGA